MSVGGVNDHSFVNYKHFIFVFSADQCPSGEEEIWDPRCCKPIFYSFNIVNTPWRICALLKIHFHFPHRCCHLWMPSTRCSSRATTCWMRLTPTWRSWPQRWEVWLFSPPLVSSGTLNWLVLILTIDTSLLHNFNFYLVTLSVTRKGSVTVS